MLLKLSARGLRPLGACSEEPFLVRVVGSDAGAPGPHDALLDRSTEGALPRGHRAYLLHHRRDVAALRDAYVLGAEHRYVGVGDVLRIDPARGVLTAVYRAGAATNSLLVTERCDNLCVMCSQPPNDLDDHARVEELERAIPLIASDAREIGITGGEPALLGPRLIRLVERLATHLPTTSVHILSNGRRFADPTFARALAAVAHPDLMVGIPLYADVADVHDYVVQARGAFDETVRGIVALKRAGVAVELRFVVHRETIEGLVSFARFVARSLTFVDHVALMALEPVGFARAHLDRLWIDPVDYGDALTEAVRWLDTAGLTVSIYNHPLCVLPAGLHRFARKSISDWKNLYLGACDGCARRDECGGFFASATVRHSRAITPFTDP